MLSYILINVVFCPLKWENNDNCLVKMISLIEEEVVVSYCNNAQNVNIEALNELNPFGTLHSEKKELPLLSNTPRDSYVMYSV